MRLKLVLVALLVLGLLHQDFWLWDSATLLLGFLPYGLAYHVGFSLLTAALWAIAVRFAWPDDTGTDQSAAAVGDRKQ